MQPLTHISRTAPITSLAFFSDSRLIAGEASCVNIFNLLDPSAPPLKKRVFERERVHGICQRGDKQRTLFWGGRSIAIVPTKSLLQIDPDQLLEDKAPDWVLAAAFLPDGSVVAIGAHNEIMVHSRDGNSSSWKTYPSAERTMLYAADLMVSPTGVVLVAAGTVFGEIIVWNWENPGNVGGTIVKRLRGHEGSVFAVHFDSTARWLGSCSDDRTVRVWDLWSAEGGERERVSTGFGEVKGEAKGGRGCTAMGWGHQARPWGVRFLPDDHGHEVGVVSISEDLTARFWSFVPRPGETVMMETRKSWMLHQGKSIWSFALDTGSKLMATGGNDGRVGILDYSTEAELRQSWLIKDFVPPAAPFREDDDNEDEPEPPQEKEKPVKKKKRKNKPVDSFKNYAVVDREQFAATTAYGRVLLYNMKEKSWRSLGTWQAMRNWSVIRAWQGTGIVAIGDNEGNLGILDIYNNRDWWWDAGGRGKVSDVFVGERDGDCFRVITTSVGVSPFTLHSFCLQGDAPPIRQTHVLLSPVPLKFAVTSALVSQITRQIFIGSRNGDLAIYALPALDSPSSELSPTAFHPALYSSDALTSLTISPSAPSTLFTTSFSGIYATHTLPSLTAINISKPGNVTVVAGLFLTGAGNKNINIYGFRGTRFIAHNTVTSADILSIDCGGAHRSWAFSPDAETPWFIWTQATRLNLAHSLRPRHVVLKHGSHGREIKTAAFCPRTRLLATGAEDTTIRIAFMGADGTVREDQAVTLKRHTTGVMNLKWSRDGTRLFSAGGVEEVFVFRVCVSPDDSIGVVPESALPVPKEEAETRVCGLDVAGGEGGGGEYWVATAMSDGLVKVWSYLPEGNVWTLRGSAGYGTCCMLHATFVETQQLGRVLVVAATDGHLAAYGILESGRKEMRQLWRQRVHQSGVKALSVVAQGDEITIFTGGDDCAIAATRVACVAGVLETQECRLVQRAHASAVTAVLPMAGGRLVTVGVDQRVKVWSAELVNEGGVQSMVADLGAAVAVGGEGVVVVGVGIEAWRLN